MQFNAFVRGSALREIFSCILMGIVLVLAIFFSSPTGIADKLGVIRMRLRISLGEQLNYLLLTNFANHFLDCLLRCFHFLKMVLEPLLLAIPLLVVVVEQLSK